MGTADAFRYIWQYLAPNGTVQARVTSVTAADPWTKAGVMVRAGTGAGAPFYAVFVTAGNGVVVQARTAPGTPAVQQASTGGTAPEYVEITQSGTAFSVSTSPDGSSWTAVPGSSMTVPLGGPVLGGLAVTSHNLTTLASVGFDGVDVTGTVHTTTTAAVDPSTTTTGSSVTYSATVAPTSGTGTPTGTVAFTTGTTTLCSAPLANGAGSCSVSTAPVGADTVVATYGGDTNFSASDGTAVLIVSPPPPPPPPVANGNLAGPVVGMASLPDGNGYWLADAEGAVSPHGNAVSYGSMAGMPLNSPITHIVGTPDGQGTGWWPWTGGRSPSVTPGSSARWAGVR